MTIEVTAAGTTPAATQTSAQNPAPAAAAVPVAPASVPSDDPKWLPMRLEQHQRSLLKTLGVESIEAAATAIADAKKISDATKSETERLRTENEALKSKAQRAEALEGALKAKADAALAALSPERVTAIKALTGDDPVKQLAALEAFSLFAPSPAASAPAASASPVTAAATPIAPIAPNSAPSAVTPEAAGAVGQVSHLAESERLQKENPMRAASYRLEHRAAIDAERKARAGTK